MLSVTIGREPHAAMLVYSWYICDMWRDMRSRRPCASYCIHHCFYLSPPSPPPPSLLLFLQEYSVSGSSIRTMAEKAAAAPLSPADQLWASVAHTEWLCTVHTNIGSMWMWKASHLLMITLIYSDLQWPCWLVVVIMIDTSDHTVHSLISSPEPFTQLFM